MDTQKMSILNFQSHKHETSNNKPSNFMKKRLTQEQVSVLESSFSSYKSLEPELKLRLARQLGLPPRRISIWYQNRRARWKAQSLEFDYNGLQHKLDVVMAEKWRLEKDVERLQEELKKAQEMLFGVNQTTGPSPSSFSTNSLDEGTTSYGVRHDQEGACEFGKQNIEDWRLEELYDCFMGGDGSSSKWN